MGKSTAVYWNPLAPEADQRWTPVPGAGGHGRGLTLSLDPEAGEITRLTRFLPGADTIPFGPKVHPDPGVVFTIRSRGARRSPGEVHGLLVCAVDCLVLEVSFPNRVE
jgi:hypothetical protein